MGNSTLFSPPPPHCRQDNAVCRLSLNDILGCGQCVIFVLPIGALLLLILRPNFQAACAKRLRKNLKEITVLKEYITVYKEVQLLTEKYIEALPI